MQKGLVLRLSKNWTSLYNSTKRNPKQKRWVRSCQSKGRTSCNSDQESVENATPGFESCARTSSWKASKAVQTKSIEALIHPVSKIIREGQTVYYCDPVTNVTSKYNQMQVPIIQFFMHFLRLDQKIFLHGGNPF